MLSKNNIAIYLYLEMFSENDIAISRLWQYYQKTTTRTIDIFNCRQKKLFPYIVIWTCFQKTSTQMYVHLHCRQKTILLNHKIQPCH